MSDNEKTSDGRRPKRPSIADKFITPWPQAEEPPSSPAPADDAPELEEEANLFSTRSLSRRQPHIMVVLRTIAGNFRALPYAYLIAIDFDPSVALVLRFTHCRVTIKGRNLLPLFRGLVAHRVALIPEIDERTDTEANGYKQDDAVVYAITIEDTD